MLFGTVGVAPGSFTFQIPPGGGQLLGPCAEDVDGPIGYGLPSHHRYDAVSRWYTSQFTAMPTSSGASVPPIIPVTPPGDQTTYTLAPGTTMTMLDPYGTDSTLKGFADAATIFGVRVDVLGIVAGLAVGTGLLVHHFAKPRRRRK